LWLAACFAAHAQNLANLPGLTDIQRPVAGAVQSACGSLSTMTSRTAEQDKLFVSCRKMVQTANALAGSGASAQSLGLTNSQLRDAVQAIGHEEVAVQGRSAVEAAGGSAVGVRLFSLRNGARGFGVAGAGEVGTPATGFASAGSGREAGGGAADEPSGRLGGFLNLNYNRGDKATTANEDGFDFRNHGVTAGLDYRFSDSFVAGVALTYGKTDATIASALGSADSRTNAVSAYGSWYSGKFYLDGHLSYSRNDYDTVRNIVVASQTGIPGFNTAATGNTKGNQVTAILGAGYDIDRGSWLITPYARVGYLKLKIDAYTESEPNHGLALDVGSQSLKSLQSALGLKIALTSSTAVGVVVPFVSLEWNHEFDNDTRSLTAKYTNDPFNNLFAIPTDTPDRNYYSLSGGLSAQFRNGLSAFASLSTVQGLKDVKNRGLAVGLRKEF
jgi:uncharacterized protein YhjY with autotransporter beta-barrel domain